jgi:hypothetical protein
MMLVGLAPSKSPGPTQDLIEEKMGIAFVLRKLNERYRH